MERSDTGNERRKPMLDVMENIALLVLFVIWFVSTLDYGMRINARKDKNLDG